jgi:hypothetical protein
MKDRLFDHHTTTGRGEFFTSFFEVIDLYPVA